MISSLKGKLRKNIGSNVVEIEINGVGYSVFVGQKYLNRHVDGEVVEVQTHMAVSENDISLYGFETRDDLNVFKLLITVSGVGPKSGAQILSQSTSDDLIRAIGEADVDFFQKIKGIGKKTAQRIIIDLKSKIGGLGELDLTKNADVEDGDELFLSLKQLGFDKKEIEAVVKKVPVDLVEIGDRLGWCLRNLV